MGVVNGVVKRVHEILDTLSDLNPLLVDVDRFALKKIRNFEFLEMLRDLTLHASKLPTRQPGHQPPKRWYSVSLLWAFSWQCQQPPVFTPRSQLILNLKASHLASLH
jgi:hypothetical protein